MGHFVGGYRLVRRLGIGRASEVLLAVTCDAHGPPRHVVIKRLLARAAGEDSAGGGGFAERALTNEAGVYERLVHPAIVQLYEVIREHGRVALVLEYVDGLPLAGLRAELRARGRALDDRAALWIALRVFEALAAAHAAPGGAVVHRDVSPGNVLVAWSGEVKLADFGIAKLAGGAGLAMRAGANDDGETRAGLLKGTYGYMAPEQVVGDAITERTDVYAACLLLRELLLRTITFPRGTLPELEFLRSMAEPALAPIESLRRGIAPEIAAALGRGLDPNASTRDLTAAEMAALLRGSGAVDPSRAQSSLAKAMARVRAARDAADARRAELGDESLEPYVTSAIVPAPASLGFKTHAWAPPRASLAPVAATLSPPRAPHEARARWPLAVALATGALFIAGAEPARQWLVTQSRSGSASAPAPPSSHARALTPTLAPPLAPALAPAPAPPLAPVLAPTPALALAPSTTTGLLHTPPSLAGHRVFFDASAIGGCGATLRVPCGVHTVRLGSRGRVQRLDIPCGGSIAASE